jgi:hypothetical protein
VDFLFSNYDVKNFILKFRKPHQLTSAKKSADLARPVISNSGISK